MSSAAVFYLIKIWVLSSGIALASYYRLFNLPNPKEKGLFLGFVICFEAVVLGVLIVAVVSIFVGAAAIEWVHVYGTPEMKLALRQLLL